MTYKVKWTQWFYDNQGDKDFDCMCLEFDTLEQAELFKADLLADIHRGCTDLRVLEASIESIRNMENEMTTTSVKDKLFKYASDYPDLVFNNDGYQRLPREVVEEHKQPIIEIESILKSAVPSFVSFQNFKLRSNGDLVIRYQAYWSDSFIGVVYTPVKEFGDDKLGG